MQIHPFLNGAFATISAQMEKDKTQESPAPKLQVQPTVAQRMQAEKAALATTVARPRQTGYVNLHGEEVGKVLNFKA